MSGIVHGLSLTALSEWTSILALIFGGCCSNALTLEQLTTHHPHAGSVITFAQFLTITVLFLPRFVVFRPRSFPPLSLRRRRVPLARYALQVVLFAAVSLLNNAAFAYAIPMPVHIIFRSGGLVASLLLNWVVLGRRYNLMQISSVGAVTFGVAITTLSAAAPKQPSSRSLNVEADPSLYVTGIGMLTLALCLSGLLGVVQDRTYTLYGGKKTGRWHVPDAARMPDIPETDTRRTTVPRSKRGSVSNRTDGDMPPWQEALFYLHFLSMPLFAFVWRGLAEQFRQLGAGRRYDVPLPTALRDANISLGVWEWAALPALVDDGKLSIPEAYIALVLNTLTQVLCVAGVHRLTARVSSLTVTLVLVVRKAVSLLISVLCFRASGRVPAGGKALQMWAGAALVFAGTVGYSVASGQGQVWSRTESEKTKRA